MRQGWREGVEREKSETVREGGRDGGRDGARVRRPSELMKRETMEEQGE